MADVLYAWPEAARFGRRLPKDAFYEAARVSTAVRQLFVAHVERMTWEFKLSPTTVGVAATDAVPEIQVFRILAKDEDVPDQVLATIDRAVQQPVVFELARDRDASAEVRMAAAYKPAGVRAAGGHASTGWMPAGADRRPLPAGADLTQLYAELLRPLVGVRISPGESPQAIAARLEEAADLQYRHNAVARKHRSERQFNRKVELRRELGRIEQEMERLR